MAPQLHLSMGPVCPLQRAKSLLRVMVCSEVCCYTVVVAFLIPETGPDRRAIMTHAEQIFRSAAELALRRGDGTFSRLDCRELLNLDAYTWTASYSPAFQGMREDQPGGAPPVTRRYRNVFRRIRRGEYTLTEVGRELANELLATIDHDFAAVAPPDIAGGLPVIHLVAVAALALDDDQPRGIPAELDDLAALHRPIRPDRPHEHQHPRRRE
jgi:hypothetical protein